MSASVWALAGRNLRRHLARSVLMGIGLMAGVVCITLTEATGEGARRAVAQSFKAMIGALDVLFVQPGGSAQRGMTTPAANTLTAEDAAAIRQAVPNVQAVGAQQSDLGAATEVGAKGGTTVLFGSTANWANIRGDSLASGAFFSNEDDTALARVAVLGSDVAHDYFPGSSPLGQRIWLGGVEFEVVGVLAPNGAGPGGISMDNLVYIPLETARRRVFNRDNLDLISVKLASPGAWSETQTAVHGLVRQRHGLAGEQLDDFRVSSPRAMIARVANVDTTLRKALLWVGALALLIGGAVIANLMFAATASRRFEIATRRAVGATRADILRQFWAEAVIVAFAAATLGTVLAVAAVQVGARAMGMPLAVSWPVTAGVVVATVVVGAMAGYIPARRAARLAPSEALRTAP